MTFRTISPVRPCRKAGSTAQHPTAPWALGIHPVPAGKISDLSENLREPGLPGIQVDNLAILTVHQIQVVS